jgi:hypothetical protein
MEVRRARERGKTEQINNAQCEDSDKEKTKMMKNINELMMIDYLSRSIPKF